MAKALHTPSRRDAQLQKGMQHMTALLQTTRRGRNHHLDPPQLPRLPWISSMISYRTEPGIRQSTGTGCSPHPILSTCNCTLVHQKFVVMTCLTSAGEEETMLRLTSELQRALQRRQSAYGRQPSLSDSTPCKAVSTESGTLVWHFLRKMRSLVFRRGSLIGLPRGPAHTYARERLMLLWSLWWGIANCLDLQIH